nr:glycosyltransferase family 4 protein [Peteryoungia ipomoeae]
MPPLVVHIVRQFSPSRGGLEDVVSNLCGQLMRQGWRVRVVTLDRLFRNPAVHLPASEMIGGIEVVRIPWRGSSRYPLAPAVLNHIADADLVHVHAIDFFYDFVALTRFMHRKPLLATTHGGFFHTPKYARLKTLWFHTATRLSGLAYDALIACSQSDAAMFRQIAGSRLRLIENGVDIEKYADASSSKPTRRLVTVGRFSDNKRLDRLLDVLADLRSRCSDWQLDIIGTPSDLSTDALRAMIDQRALFEAATIHVGVDEDEVREIFGRASLFISASEYEGFGLVAVEAMSAGLIPVLHHNAAYQALAARHRCIAVTDFARPAEGAAAIEAALARLQSNPLMRDEAKAAAGGYGWARVREAHMSLYRDVLQSRKPRTL